MDLHDFGSLIWAIFILIAVISSVFRSARRSISSAQQQQQQTQQTTQPKQSAPQPVSPMAQARRLTPQAPPARIFVPPVIPAVSESAHHVVEKAVTDERAWMAERGGTAAGAEPGRRSDERFRGDMVQARASVGARKLERIFGTGNTLARGVIALEVLGPPRALRDWSAGFPS